MKVIGPLVFLAIVVAGICEWPRRWFRPKRSADVTSAVGPEDVSQPEGRDIASRQEGEGGASSGPASDYPEGVCGACGEPVAFHGTLKAYQCLRALSASVSATGDQS